jgi:hypothetical protein
LRRISPGCLSFCGNFPEGHAPYKHPKLSAAAIGHFSGESFAEQLERCIARSQSTVPMLNGPTPMIDAAETKKPFASYRRF